MPKPAIIIAQVARSGTGTVRATVPFRYPLRKPRLYDTKVLPPILPIDELVQFASAVRAVPPVLLYRSVELPGDEEDSRG